MKVHITGANTCWIDTKNGQYLQSYNTIVACLLFNNPDKQGYIRYTIKHGQPQSVTTAKHLTQWLGEPYKQALNSGRAVYGDIPEL